MSPITAIGKHQRLGPNEEGLGWVSRPRVRPVAGPSRELAGTRPARLQLVCRQMRRTERNEMSMALAIARLIQWVARRGGAMHVNANTRVVVCAPTAERRE
jgi:hypothetical protein